MHDTQGKAIKISRQDVQEYIEKGPEHHGTKLAEFIGDIKQLVQAMSVLMEASPITMMIGEVEVECIVRAHGTEYMHVQMGGRPATEEEYKNVQEG